MCIPERYVHCLAQYAASRGVQLLELLTPGERKQWDVFANSGEYPFLVFACLVERCAAAANDDAFALDYVSELPARPSGVFQTIIANSTNLRDAFCGVVRMCAVKTSSLTLRYQEDGQDGFVDFAFEPELQDKQQFVAGEIAIIALRVREQLGKQIKPSFVEFTFPVPRALQAYTDLFGQNVKFSTGHNRIGYSLALLHEPLPKRSVNAGIGNCEVLRAAGERAAIPQHVAAFLRGAMQRGEASEIDVCRALNIGRRTLQRELLNAGTSFRRLLEDERRRAAEYYLTTTDLSLLAISGLLGYSEQSAFSRACRGWFGKTPSAIRRAAINSPVTIADTGALNTSV